MHKMKQIILPILLAIFSFHVAAQDNEGETARTIPLLSVNAAAAVPGADMARQFGTGFTIGASFDIKTAGNVLLGVEGNFLFGGKVKNQDEILAGISTSDGFVIAGSGYYADIAYEERGFTAFFKGGIVLPVIGSNPNSGLFFLAGPGYFQHKIRLDNTDNIAPQIYGEYKKGYDKLRGGFALSENIGYLNIESGHLLKFQAGLEFTEAWTQTLRSYDFNLKGKDTSRHFDMLYSIKIGWIIPFTKKHTEKYYYY
jgi:hypothetical protein